MNISKVWLRGVCNLAVWIRETRTHLETEAWSVNGCKNNINTMFWRIEGEKEHIRLERSGKAYRRRQHGRRTMKNKKNFHRPDNRDVNETNTSCIYFALGTVWSIFIAITPFNLQKSHGNSAFIIIMSQMRKSKRWISPRSHGKWWIQTLDSVRLVPKPKSQSLHYTAL